MSLAAAVTTPVSLGLKEDATYTKWENLGRTLGAMDAALPWWIGDWGNEGIREFGEKADQALSEIGLSYSTIRNYIWVSERVPPERRKESLSFGHHQVVAAMNERAQAKWLSLAEAEDLSRAALRKRISESREAPPSPEQPSWTPPEPTIVIAVTVEELEFLRSVLDGSASPIGAVLYEKICARLDRLAEDARAESE